MEEETGAGGLAFGQFGPVELDPQAKQTLEQVLGTGGSQFPVSIMLKSSTGLRDQMGGTDEHNGGDDDDDLGDGGFTDAEDQGIEGKMFVNQHMIKICFKDDKNDKVSPKEESKKGLSKAKSPRKGPGASVASSGGSRPSIKAKKSPKAKDSANNGDVISLKYTIDYPRVELHPFDTKKFLLYYADSKIDGRYDCNRCVEMRANTR